LVTAPNVRGDTRRGPRQRPACTRRVPRAWAHPVQVTIGGTEFTTALFPKDGRYLVPVKVAVQRAEAIGEGAIVEVVLRLNAARRP